MAIRSCLRGNFLVAAMVLASVCQAFQPGDEKEVQSAQPKEQSEADRMVIQAFGADSNELGRPIRFSLQAKGPVVAAEEFAIEKDGRVRLARFSAALFHKSKASDGHPEITTIRCDTTFLTLDRPVSQIGELANRKIIKVEMQDKRRGFVLLSHRRTADKSNAFDIIVTKGNLFYEQARNLLWTDGVVRLTDFQTKPPMELRGKGFEMKMSKPLTGDAGKLNASVERLVFRSDVEARFSVDATCRFLNVSREQTKPAEKAPIEIRADGMLIYDLIKGTASIEIPSGNEEKKNQKDQLAAPRIVHLQRRAEVDGKGWLDQLICDRLDLQIRPNGEVMEITTAKATARPGNDVVLSLDGEGVAAYASSFFYERGVGSTAAKALLKGKPLRIAIGDGIKLSCTELHLADAGKKGTARSVTAVGPGELDLREHGTADVYSKHIRWRDKLIFVNARAGLGNFDSLKAYGAASFIDDRSEQEVNGEQIDVKLRGWQKTPPTR